MSDKATLSPVEGIKVRSRGLRGTLEASLQNQLTGQLAADDQQLIKFHGTYQQDDRDRREERERKKLEPAYSFMVRLRLPGGDLTPEQWIGMQELADANTTGTIKITTRQTIQVHGVIKSKLKPTMQWFDRYGLDAIAACGDVNRNVCAGAHPAVSAFHEEVHAFADKISTHLLPKTKGYAEIWLDGERLDEGAPAEEDPLYKDVYLPRKFKIGIAIPPHNDTDVFTNDIGLIAIEEDGAFAGFNVAIGGGMGATHGNPDTYPRLATVIGFVTPEQTLDTVWQIAAVQRDFGNREDRKQARMKYTIDRMGVDAFKKELESRLDFALAEAKEFAFESRGDIYGWTQDHAGRWHYTLFVENGLVRDEGEYRLKSGILALAERGGCKLRFTTNQNLMLVDVADADKADFEAILQEYGLTEAQRAASNVRRDALACVAMNTCPLALAEAQRYMPSFLTKVEALLAKHDMAEQGIHIRMTGCPNGCARPYVAEIGLIGRNPGRYNLHLGGDALGQRLNTLYQEDADEGMILETLDGLFGRYVSEREAAESFGDFTARVL